MPTMGGADLYGGQKSQNMAQDPYSQQAAQDPYTQNQAADPYAQQDMYNMNGDGG